MPERARGVDSYEPDIGEVLWRAWKAMVLPEGYRAEVLGEAIDVSAPAGRRPGILVDRLRKALEAPLAGGGLVAHQGGNVIHRREGCVPDLFVGPEDLDEIPDEEGLGVDATRVPLVAEVVSPGADAHRRDHIRKQRWYAQAGVPVYLVIDDFDGQGTVTVFSGPAPERAAYATKTTVAYGTPVVVPDGPGIKGLEITEALTGP
ncbi:Uma2 family endonuclease [Streptomyces sp. AB3(2024)]|uniref:Uma2 family endonuclease n=1 Tax=Streptomyces sp. AB3(2024) TaxID=3317321 RepID=UPI0035A2AFAC